MKSLTIYQESLNTSTAISNQFIDIYMKDANDAQIKIYLYLLRMMGADRSTSISEMADKFNHTEKDVLRALKYWEKMQLLSLDYDGGRNITGIHLKDLDMRQAVRDAVSGESTARSGAAGQDEGTLPSAGLPPASGSPLPPDGTSPAALSATDNTAGSSAEDNTAPSPEDSYTRPSYSLDQLKAFKAQADTEQLLFIVEQYIGKPLSTSDIKTILFFCDRLHFSADLIDYLVQYCVDRGKKDFRYIEKVAISWAEDNITTPKQAAALMRKHDKGVYGIMNALGKSGAPTAKEMEYINRWNKEFRFPADVIREACDRTVLATDRHRFEYADSILSNWNRENVRHISDIKAVDERYQKNRAQSASVQVKVSANRFNQFKQNDYDFDALEKELLSN